jgi:hypothetical protein
MTKAKKLVQNTVVEAHHPSSLPGKLKRLGGSKSDVWNNVLANQTIQTLWAKNSSQEERSNQISATVAAMIGIGPNDELEGTMAAQLVACHNASMECYRRAMIGDQTFEGRRENLTKRTNFPVPTPRFENLSIATAARGNRRSLSNMSTSTKAAKPLSATWRGWDADQTGESTPCRYPCTGRNVAEHERGAGSLASRPRWQTVDAECTVVPRRVHRRAIGTHSSRVPIRRRKSRDGGRFRP